MTGPAGEAASLAERALAEVREGDGAQATVCAERSLLLRFAHSRPTQASAVDDVTVELSVVRAGHLASARTNRTDAEGLADCARAAERSAAAAARAGAGGGYPGFAAPARTRAHDGYDPATARLEAAAGSAALSAAFDVAAAHRVDAHGVWTAGAVETAIATTTGLVLHERVTDAYMKVSCLTERGRSGYWSRTARSHADLDPRAIAERSARRAAAPGTPARLEPGEYRVVLEAPAVGDLCGWLGRIAFNGQAYAEERSVLSGRLGTRVAAASVNLADSPRHPRTLPRTFDLEGVPKAPVPLIQDGVAMGVVHDRRSAALAGAGATSTGHALQPGGAPTGPMPTNLVLSGGGCRSLEELCRPIERGVLVTRLWYTNAVRPRETLITGVTRDGTFLIEDGEVSRPLEDLRLTDRVLGIFERVEDLGSSPELTNEGHFYGRRFAYGAVCPPLRSSTRFTA